MMLSEESASTGSIQTSFSCLYQVHAGFKQAIHAAPTVCAKLQARCALPQGKLCNDWMLTGIVRILEGEMGQHLDGALTCTVDDNTDYLAALTDRCTATREVLKAQLMERKQAKLASRRSSNVGMTSLLSPKIPHKSAASPPVVHLGLLTKRMALPATISPPDLDADDLLHVPEDWVRLNWLAPEGAINSFRCLNSGHPMAASRKPLHLDTNSPTLIRLANGQVDFPGLSTLRRSVESGNIAICHQGLQLIYGELLASPESLDGYPIPQQMKWWLLENVGSTAVGFFSYCHGDMIITSDLYLKTALLKDEQRID
ncbi:hypothetical protein WJX84_008221 [Apatococcus fuscideae]|uniref:Uncharacterized protein n=1 Tax=Apatococcus fuscideae TaxID=2026836 RepID=A0AAW1TCE6_9CHLO